MSRRSRGYSGVVGRPSRMSGSDQKAPRMSRRGRKALPNVRGVLPKIWEWSETLLDVQEWSGGPPG